MNRISPNSLKKLFLAIATQHPGIGNITTTVDSITTYSSFFGWNNDEALTAEKSGLKYPRLGMALKHHTGMAGDYTSQGGSTLDKLMTEILLLDKSEKGDFNAEYQIYDDMKVVADDIVTWLQHISSTDKINYPAVAFLNIAKIQYARVGPLHQNAYGWKLSIPAQDSIIYLPDSNPLDSMAPVGY